MNEYPYANDTSRNIAAPIGGFVLGAMLGAGVALLLAPAPGSDVRRRVGETARRWGNNARHGFNRVRESAKGIKEDAKSAMDAGRHAFHETRQSRDLRRDSWQSGPVSPESSL